MKTDRERIEQLSRETGRPVHEVAVIYTALHLGMSGACAVPEMVQAVYAAVEAVGLPRPEATERAAKIEAAARVLRAVEGEDMTPVWKDTSSYSRNDTERVPKEWTLDLGVMRIVVHGHIHAPGVRFVSAHALDIDRHELKATEPDDAQAEALRVVRRRVDALGAALDRVGGRS